MCVLLVSASCSSPPHLILYNTETEWVDLREWPVSYTPVGSHSHPFDLSSDEVGRILRSVYYRESILFSFVLGKPKRLFSEYQLDLLSNYLSRAFDQALPQEIVAFKIKEEKDSLRYTEGFCFRLHDDFHLVIEEFNTLDFHNKETRPQPTNSRTEFVPQKGQRLFASRSEGKGLIKNWIVISLTSEGTER